VTVQFNSNGFETNGMATLRGLERALRLTGGSRA